MSTEVRADNESTSEHAVVGAAVALALVVGLGFGALKLGMLDSWLGGDALDAAAPLVAAIHTLSGGDPERILISGNVVNAKEGAAVEAKLRQLFPGSEVKNSARVVADAKGPQPKKPAPPPRASTVRVSFAADAINEAWPRPRFGDVKRLEMVWKDGKITVRGAVFTPAAKQALDKAFEAIPKDNRASLQVREVARPVVPAAELQQTISVALGGRVIALDSAGAVAADDAAVAAVAPVLTDLRGLEVWISAGADDRALSLKQAEAVKAALVAKGADGNGLRAVPAAKNNALSLIVREKD